MSNHRTGLYAIVAVARHTGVMEVHLTRRGQPWTTVGGAERVLRELQEQLGTGWQLSVVQAVQS